MVIRTSLPVFLAGILVMILVSGCQKRDGLGLRSPEELVHMMDQCFAARDFEGLTLLAGPEWRESWRAYLAPIRREQEHRPPETSELSQTGDPATWPSLVGLFPMPNPLGHPGSMPRDMDSLLFDWQSPALCIVRLKNIGPNGRLSLTCMYSTETHEWFIAKPEHWVYGDEGVED